MTSEKVELMLIKDNPKELDNFIRENKKFILTQTYKTCHRFVNECDDEYSIALIAFSEAINSYDKAKGNFYGFASLVIKRRLLDYIKFENRHAIEYSVETETLDGDLGNEEDISALKLEVQDKLVKESLRYNDKITIKDEILDLSDKLSIYGFTFMDISTSSPKAQKTKKQCGLVINYITSRAELVKVLRETKTLPVKKICENIKVPRKILERHRKYIITVVEIIYGDYPQLAEYVKDIGKES